jgi:adenosylhomocysteine nucleosidase
MIRCMLINRIAAFIVVLCGALAAMSAPASEAPALPVYYKPTDTIVILGAVPQEITLITQAMGNPAPQTLWGIPYYQCKLG